MARRTSAGYQEPSLVFLLGTNTRLVGEQQAAQHLFADPGCAVALVPSHNAPVFAATLASAGLTPTSIGQVSGANYSDGGRVSLTLYTLAARPRGTDQPMSGPCC